MSKLFPFNYSLYDSVYGSDIPIEQYYIILFDTLPSKFTNSNLNYDESVVEYFKLNGFIEHSRIYSNNRRMESMSSQSILVNKEKKIIIKVNGNVDRKKSIYLQLEFIYNILSDELSKQIDLDDLKKFERKKKRANINLVKSEMGHMDTEEYDLFVPPVNLDLNYGENFLKIHNVIVKKLNEDHGKGIILLHGDPGTGKTSYIKFLTSLITEKEILFIPPSMAEMLSEPTIIPFLMDHKNSILIIEDAERVISDREGNGSPAGVSNILNLTDGILGDCLNIQVVATFNMKREKIDQALLRKGRLIAEHKFEKLNINETNKLLKYLKKDYVVTEPMSLADIYNIDVEVYKTVNKGKIGF